MQTGYAADKHSELAHLQFFLKISLKKSSLSEGRFLTGSVLSDAKMTMFAGMAIEEYRDGEKNAPIFGTFFILQKPI
jgi:hypothetical protein